MTGEVRYINRKVGLVLVDQQVVVNPGTEVCKGYGFVTVADEAQVRHRTVPTSLPVYW